MRRDECGASTSKAPECRSWPASAEPLRGSWGSVTGKFDGERHDDPDRCVPRLPAAPVRGHHVTHACAPAAARVLTLISPTGAFSGGLCTLRIERGRPTLPVRACYASGPTSSCGSTAVVRRRSRTLPGATAVPRRWCRAVRRAAPWPVLLFGVESSDSTEIPNRLAQRPWHRFRAQ